MSGYDDKLHMDLAVNLSAEEAARHYAEEFVADLIEDAAPLSRQHARLTGERTALLGARARYKSVMDGVTTA